MLFYLLFTDEDEEKAAFWISYTEVEENTLRRGDFFNSTGKGQTMSELGI